MHSPLFPSFPGGFVTLSSLPSTPEVGERATKNPANLTGLGVAPSRLSTLGAKVVLRYGGVVCGEAASRGV
jgi:hypothetical protein